MIDLNVLSTMVGIAGGSLGIVGGVLGLLARYLPPKLIIFHTEFVGFVVDSGNCTRKIHLPVVISNMSNKPGVITYMGVQFNPDGQSEKTRFEWDLFWQEDKEGTRSPERRPIPVSVPAQSTAEKSIQFATPTPIELGNKLYQADIEIRAGRRKTSKRMSRFFFRPSKERISRWYGSGNNQGPLVENLPIYPDKNCVPLHGD